MFIWRLSVYRYPSVRFFFSDQFKILADDQLHYKSSRIKKKVGVTTTTYPTTPSYTRHIAIFAVFGCFWPVWRPVAQPNNYILTKLFYQSKGKTFPVILQSLWICYLMSFKSYAKKTFVWKVSKLIRQKFSGLSINKWGFLGCISISESQVDVSVGCLSISESQVDVSVGCISIRESKKKVLDFVF